MVFDGLFVHFVMCSSCQMEFARPPHNFALSLFHSLCHTQICAVVPSVRLVFAHPPLLFYYPTFPLLLFRPISETTRSAVRNVNILNGLRNTLRLRFTSLFRSQLFRSRIKFSNFSSHQQTKSNATTLHMLGPFNTCRHQTRHKMGYRKSANIIRDQNQCVNALFAQILGSHGTQAKLLLVFDCALAGS